MATSPTDKQISYMLQLANKLTGQSARYASQSSIDLRVKTGPEASAVIDELQAAIEAHAKWQAETGLVPGAKIRRRYTTRDGEEIIVSGEVTGYKWSGLEVGLIWFEPDAATRAARSWEDSVKLGVAQLGDEVADGPKELKAERAKLMARIAEIDAILGRS
jgi:hypothetical protein